MSYRGAVTNTSTSVFFFTTSPPPALSFTSSGIPLQKLIIFAVGYSSYLFHDHSIIFISAPISYHPYLHLYYQLVILFIMNFSTKAVLSALSMFGGTARVAAVNHPVPNDAICLTQGKIHFSTTTTAKMMMMTTMMMNYFIHHLYQANITLVRRDSIRCSLSSHIDMSLTLLSSLIPTT